MFIPARGNLLTSWVRENRSFSLSIYGSHSVWKGRRSCGPSGTLSPTQSAGGEKLNVSHGFCQEGGIWIPFLCLWTTEGVYAPQLFLLAGGPSLSGRVQGLRWVGYSPASAHFAQAPSYPVELAGRGERRRKEGKTND